MARNYKSIQEGMDGMNEGDRRFFKVNGYPTYIVKGRQEPRMDSIMAVNPPGIRSKMIAKKGVSNKDLD